jgi:hypothetical protein
MRVEFMKVARVSLILAALLFVAAALFQSVKDTASGISSIEKAEQRIERPMQDALQARFESGEIIIFDYSIGWAVPSFADRCTSLIFGDSFSLEVSADEILRQCPQVVLAGLYNDQMKPLAPFLAFDPGRQLKYAHYCNEIKARIDKGFKISIVTPTRDFTYLDARTIVEENGWRLAQVKSIRCSSSLERNEQASPATTAARERVSRLPLIGPVYRNWPFKEELKR